MVAAQLRAGEERTEGGGQRCGVELADRDLDRVAAAKLGLEVLRAWLGSGLGLGLGFGWGWGSVGVGVRVRVRLRVRVATRSP